MVTYGAQVTVVDSDSMQGDDNTSVLCVHTEESDAPTATALSADEFDVTLVRTLRDALDRFENTAVDCIVSDARLPDADALQFLQAIRVDNPDLPFILYAEADATDIVSDAISASVTDYVIAGDDAAEPERFATLVRHAVAQYRDGHGQLASTGRAQTVLDAAPDAIVVVADGSVVFSNPAAASLFGAASDNELSGTDLAVLDDSDQGLSSLLAPVWGGEALLEQSDVQLQTLDGGTLTAEVTARRVEWEGQSGAVAVLRDVGDAKTRAALRERDLQLKGVLNTAPAAIFVKDTDGRYLLMNDNCRELLDVPRGQDVTGLTDAALFPDDVAGQYRHGDQQVFDAGETIEFEEGVPVDDGTRRFLTRKTPLFDEAGNLFALVGVATDITARKEQERELRERVKELSAIHRTIDIFESQPDNFEAAFREFVETLPQSFQHPDQTAIRLRYGDTIASTADFVSTTPRIRERMETTDGTPLELEASMPEGFPDSRPWAETDQPFLEEESNLLRTLLAVVAGYAERTEQIAELERYETTLKALGDPVYALDRDGCLTFANDALVERTGYSRDELLGDHVSKIITEAGIERGRGVIRGLLSADRRATARWEMDLKTADGDRIPSENHVALLPFDGDGSFRGTAGVIRDISDQKAREYELQRSRDHLLRTEEMADVGGWEFDVEDSDLRWTNGTRRIHEVSDEYEPTLEKSLSFFHPEDRGTVERAVEKCREAGKSFDVEARLMTAEGRERWVQARGERVDSNGSPILRGTIQDITASKETEQQLMVLNRVLRHNLRNNINVVTANTELLSDTVRDIASALESGDSSPEQMLDRLETIEASAWELRTLADKARQLSDTIEQTDATELVAVSQLVSDLVETYRTEHPDATITSETEDVEILGNHVALELAVGELLTNAIVHSDCPDPTVSVSVTQPSSARVQIRVADDGPGIPEMERQALERGAETALEHGSGLGLWTVNWLTTRLGGSIAIADRDPTGTTVTLELPAA